MGEARIGLTPEQLWCWVPAPAMAPSQHSYCREGSCPSRAGIYPGGTQQEPFHSCSCRQSQPRDRECFSSTRFDLHFLPPPTPSVLQPLLSGSLQLSRAFGLSPASPHSLPQLCHTEGVKIIHIWDGIAVTDKVVNSKLFPVNLMSETLWKFDQHLPPASQGEPSSFLECELCNEFPQGSVSDP